MLAEICVEITLTLKLFFANSSAINITGRVGPNSLSKGSLIIVRFLLFNFRSHP